MTTFLQRCHIVISQNEMQYFSIYLTNVSHMSLNSCVIPLLQLVNLKQQKRVTRKTSFGNVACFLFLKHVQQRIAGNYKSGTILINNDVLKTCHYPKTHKEY